jgi:Mechanosensitive ion channel, conserved TM helix
MKQLVLNSLDQTLGRFYDMLLQFLPHLLAMLIIAAIGWLLAIILKVIARRLMALASVNKLSDISGISQILSKADLPPPLDLLSQLVFWVVWIAFILVGIDSLGIPELHEQIARLFQLLPQIFVALLVLFVGLLAANFFSRAALLAAINANLPSARIIAAFVRFIIILLTIAMALEQLALAQRTVLITFSIAFGAIMMGLAIAFGIGGRNVAQKALERMFESAEPKKEEEKVEQFPPL